MKIDKLKYFSVLLAILLAGVSSARAQVVNPADLPGFTDGVWDVVLTHSGTVDIESATADPIISGGGELTVIEGVISGKYSVSGTTTISGPYGTGSGVMSSSGEWTGTATKPAMADGQTTINGTVTVDGNSQNVSFTFPATDRITVIPIVTATCTIVIGDWPYVANTAFSGAGVSSSISGSFVAIRKGAAMVGDKDLTYFDKANSLMTEGVEFISRVGRGMPVDYSELNSLLTSAEEFYLLILRQADCGVGDAKDYLSVIAGMVWDLLSYAVEHPESFNNFQLQRVMLAAARTGLIDGSVPSSDGFYHLSDDLSLDVKTREEEVREKNDCHSGLALLSITAILGGGDLAVEVASTVGKVCVE